MGEMTTVDVAVLGAGPGGEAVVRRLRGSGLSVVVVERELVGGECAYWACVPSKTLLRPGEIRAAGRRFPGVLCSELDWDATAAYRDQMISDLDDSAKSAALLEAGASIVRGTARTVAPGRVMVGTSEIRCRHLVIATGSEPAVPSIEGLDEVDWWGTRDVYTMRRPPSDAVVLGGGPVGLETAQMLARCGSRVTIVEDADRLLANEDAGVGRELETALRADGIDVRVRSQVGSVRPYAGRVRAAFDGGEELEAERLVIATGRSPRTEGFGFETAGITPNDDGEIEVDEYCRAAEGVWAVGDVTARMPFTHVAHYQGEVAADDIAGRPRAADYRGIPRVVFTDPEVASVGLTRHQAEEAGLSVGVGTVQMSQLARSGMFGVDTPGFMTVIADREAGTLVGAVAVAPLASEFIGAAALAIRLQAPLAILAESTVQFPTFGEALPAAIRNLEL